MTFRRHSKQTVNLEIVQRSGIIQQSGKFRTQKIFFYTRSFSRFQKVPDFTPENSSWNRHHGDFPHHHNFNHTSGTNITNITSSMAEVKFCKNWCMVTRV